MTNILLMEAALVDIAIEWVGVEAVEGEIDPVDLHQAQTIATTIEIIGEVVEEV